MKRGNYYLWSVRGAELSLLKIHNDATTYPPPSRYPAVNKMLIQASSRVKSTIKMTIRFKLTPHRQ